MGLKLKVTAGAATGLVWSIECTRKGGNVSVIGVYGPPWNLVPMGTAMNKGLTLRMSQCNTKRYMPHLLKHIQNGDVSAKEIITHRVPLEETHEAYEIFAHKKENCIKAVLVPPGMH